MSSHFAPLQIINDPLIARSGVTLCVLRLDQYDSHLSGNKYFKLKYNIQRARELGARQLLSFGGAYSNHIHALAMAGQQQHMETIGIIRGQQTLPLNSTLQDASDAGMSLQFVSREQYRQRHHADYLQQLQQQYPGAYIIPEGGSNLLGVKGCMEIVDHIQHAMNNGAVGISDYDTVIMPCGTAATLAGVAAAAADKQVLGIAVLKNADYLAGEVREYHQGLGGVDGNNWQLIHDYHGGGYAKLSYKLAVFIENFQQRHAITIEPVYSGKMFYALYDLLEQGYFAPGSNIVAIHTGGLQGLRGMQNKMAQLLSA